jgi:hypothetical protein
MKKNKLISQLKHHMIMCGDPDNELSKEKWKMIVCTLDEYSVLESFITCPCCGEDRVTGGQLDRIIEFAETSAEFIEMLDEVEEMNITMPLVLKAKMLRNEGNDFKYLLNDN